MLGRVEAGEDGGQRRPRPARLRVGASEAGALAGERVDVRRRRPRVADDRQRVAAQAVDDEEQQVGLPRRAVAAEQEQRRGERRAGACASWKRRPSAAGEYSERLDSPAERRPRRERRHLTLAAWPSRRGRDAGVQRRADAAQTYSRDPARRRRRGPADRRRQRRRDRARSRASSASPPSCTRRTAATAATRRPATRRRCARGADIVVMLHPDYQYTPRLIPAMAALIACDVYDVVLGSRILVGSALARRHAALQVRRQPRAHRWPRTCSSAASSRSSTPATAPSRARVLETLPLLENSDDFVFDNQMLLQALYLRLPRRRDQLPGALRGGLVVDQLPAQRRLRLRRAGHGAALPAGALGACPAADLRSGGAAARGGGDGGGRGRGRRDGGLVVATLKPCSVNVEIASSPRSSR